MFGSDNIFGNFLSLGLMAGSFYAGRKMAQNDAVQIQQHANAQNEIAALNQQVSEMKMIMFHIMQNQKK